MTDTAEDERSRASDLAFLKRLANAGRGEPAPFLLLMAVFGGVYGLALLLTTVALARGPEAMLNDPGPFTGVIRFYLWPTAHLAFGLTILWTAWRTLGPRRAPLSRAAAAIWTSAFIGLITMVAAFRIYGQDQPASDEVYVAYMLAPVLLVLWGSAWWVSAILSERRWLLVVAVGSFLAAIVMAMIGNRPAILPTGSACLLLLAFAPAVILIKQRRA